jgi:hypothetical protein
MWGRIAALACALVIAGCATVYRQDGVEKLAATDASAIVMDNPTCLGACVSVTLVDGVRRGLGQFARYELVPGPHEIACQYLDFAKGTSDEHAILAFTSEAGHTYRIRPNADYVQMKWNPEIVDEQSGRVVSRITGFRHVW